MLEGNLKQKTVLVIQDISCIGRCSALAALPVLSCAGLYTVPLPTVLLSSHTGGFLPVYRRDLSEDMKQIIEAWGNIPFSFDAIYIGYIGEPEQLALIDALLERYRLPQTLLFVDPVMGDHGKRYRSCPEALTDGFRRLCAQADVIFPNRTEAALLLKCDYEHLGTDEEVVKALQVLGSKACVLTGASEKAGEIGAISIGYQEEKTHYTAGPEHSGGFPGTGDLFASTVIGGVMNEHALQESCALAVHFVERCIARALCSPLERRFGVPFEQELGLITDFYRNHQSC